MGFRMVTVLLSFCQGTAPAANRRAAAGIAPRPLHSPPGLPRQPRCSPLRRDRGTPCPTRELPGLGMPGRGRATGTGTAPARSPICAVAPRRPADGCTGMELTVSVSENNPPFSSVTAKVSAIVFFFIPEILYPRAIKVTKIHPMIERAGIYGRTAFVNFNFGEYGNFRTDTVPAA